MYLKGSPRADAQICGGGRELPPGGGAGDGVGGGGEGLQRGTSTGGAAGVATAEALRLLHGVDSDGGPARVVGQDDDALTVGGGDGGGRHLRFEGEDGQWVLVAAAPRQAVEGGGGGGAADAEGVCGAGVPRVGEDAGRLAVLHHLDGGLGARDLVFSSRVEPLHHELVLGGGLCAEGDDDVRGGLLASPSSPALNRHGQSAVLCLRRHLSPGGGGAQRRAALLQAQLAHQVADGVDGGLGGGGVRGQVRDALAQHVGLVVGGGLILVQREGPLGGLADVVGRKEPLLVLLLN